MVSGFVLRYMGLWCWCNIMTDSSNLSSWGGLGEPYSSCELSGFCGTPKMPRSSSLWSGVAALFTAAETERKMQGGFFLLSCISSCNLTLPPTLWTWSSHLVSSLLPPLFHPPFTLPPLLTADLCRFLSLCCIRLGKAQYSN